MSPSEVTKHLRALEQKRVIEPVRGQKRVFYRAIRTGIPTTGTNMPYRREISMRIHGGW